MNNLNVYKLPKNSLNNNEIKDNLIFMSRYENNSLFSLGYHYYIGRTRAALASNIINVKTNETTNEFYYVVNKFEINISNYTEPLFEYDNRDYYKFIEIYFLFDIINNDTTKIISINDESNSIELFRDKYFDKKDKILNEYKKNVLAELIISNNYANTENEFIEILINEIKNIIESQDKNGNLILRIFDTFTLPTIKLLYILTSFYDESYIYKPLYSRPSDSEKYLICKKFMGKDTRKLISSIDEILNIIKKKDKYISNIYFDMEIPDEYLNVFKYVNIKLVNEQQILINEIIKYIKENNYFGDKYHEHRNQQIDSNKFWIKNFLTPTKLNYKTTKTNFNDIIKSKIEKNNIDKDKFIQNLI
jgi:hypothetical protein